jgi:phage terminase small subunit
MANPRTSSSLSVLADRSEEKAKLFKVPPMPQAVPECLKGEYTDLIKSLHAAKTWRANLLPLVESYLLNLHAQRVAMETLKEQGHYVTDSAGNVKTHPALIVLGKSSTTIATLARALCIQVGADMMKADATTAPTGAAAKTRWSA